MIIICYRYINITMSMIVPERKVRIRMALEKTPVLGSGECVFIVKDIQVRKRNRIRKRAS
jgi:hypothetical protein